MTAGKDRPRVIFIHRGLSLWRHVLGLDPKNVLLEVARTCRDGRDVWILTAYLQLLARIPALEISDAIEPGAICIAHSDDLPYLENAHKAFLVAIRADKERCFTNDMEIVQSPSSVESNRSYYIPHWPQQGLLARDPRRGNRLRTIAFVGRAENLAAVFRSPGFRDELAELGVELRIVEDRRCWHDYRDVDLVLAVRDGVPYYLASKPATKLFNAWLAGCVALVGAEPAFHYHGAHDRDFLHVSSPDDVLATIRSLIQSPERYERLRDRSAQRGKDFSAAQIADRWHAFIDNVAIPEFNKQYRQPRVVRDTRAYIRHRFGAFRKRLRGRHCKRDFDWHGHPITRYRTRRGRIALRLDMVITYLENLRIKRHNPYSRASRAHVDK